MCQMKIVPFCASPRKGIRVIPPPHSLNQSKCIVEAQWDWEILENLTLHNVSDGRTKSVILHAQRHLFS